MFQQMGKDCTSCRHGVHFFDETSSDSANVKKESNNKRGEKQKVWKRKKLKIYVKKHLQPVCKAFALFAY